MTQFVEATTQTGVVQPPSYLTYNNTNYGIEVSYPSDWKIEEKDFQSGDFFTNIVEFRPPFDAKNKLTATGHQLIQLGIYHESQPFSLDFSANDLVNNFKPSFHNFHTVNVTTRGLTFDDKPAMKIIFSSEENNNIFKRILLGFANGNDVYFAIYKMKEKNFQKFLPVFDKMVNSYNFTAPLLSR